MIDKNRVVTITYNYDFLYVVKDKEYDQPIPFLDGLEIDPISITSHGQYLTGRVYLRKLWKTPNNENDPILLKWDIIDSDDIAEDHTTFTKIDPTSVPMTNRFSVKCYIDIKC